MNDFRKSPVPTGKGGLEMFRNRLRKNKKELAKLAKQNSVTSYRLYDKDIPQVPVIVDLYREILTGDIYIVFQYFRGQYDVSDDGNDAVMDERITAIKDIILEVMDVTANRLFVKLRERKKGTSQYEKLSQDNLTISVQEAGAKLWINLSDYLDTGLFLDHRPLRLRVGRESGGKKILNLFCYTGAFTVHSALGGAESTTNVDLSGTYLDWAEKNLLLNGINLSRHRFIEEDVVAWVKNPKNRMPYDIIILDPPTFSNSKKINQLWDIQKDIYPLIESLLDGYLSSEGVIYFSTNFRKFIMDMGKIHGKVEDISDETIPFDVREKKIHRTWKITKKAGH